MLVFFDERRGDDEDGEEGNGIKKKSQWEEKWHGFRGGFMVCFLKLVLDSCCTSV